MIMINDKSTNFKFKVNFMYLWRYLKTSIKDKIGFYKLQLHLKTSFGNVFQLALNNYKDLNKDNCFGTSWFIYSPLINLIIHTY